LKMLHYGTMSGSGKYVGLLARMICILMIF